MVVQELRIRGSYQFEPTSRPQPIYPQPQSPNVIQPQIQDILYLLPGYNLRELKVYIEYSVPIGKGSFSSVWNGFLYDLQEIKVPVAVKEFALTKNQWEMNYYQNYEAEVEALALLSKCKQAVKMIGAFYMKHNYSKKLYIILQKCEGTVKSHFQTINSNEKLVMQVMEQLINYLNSAHHVNCSQVMDKTDDLSVYLKNSQESMDFKNSLTFSRLSLPKWNFFTVIHKDIKPANILIRKLGNYNIQIAVADFGMASICKSDAEFLQSNFGGTLNYQSPEMQMKSSYDSRVDCWSTGLVLYQLFIKKFLQLSKMSKSAKIKKYRYSCSHLLLQLGHFQNAQKVACIIRNCLHIKKDKRLFSYQIKAIWNNFEFFKQQQVSNKEEQLRLKNILCHLIVIQGTLIEEYNRQNKRIRKKYLQKLCQAGKDIIRWSVKNYPFLFKGMELYAISNLTENSRQNIQFYIKRHSDTLSLTKKPRLISQSMEQTTIAKLIRLCQTAPQFSEKANREIANLQTILMKLSCKSVS